WVPSTASSALFGTDIADYWFPVAQGGDIAFIYGVLKVGVENGWLDEQFLNERCTGWADLKFKIQNLEFKILEKGAGLSRSSFEEFARLMQRASTGVFVW